MRKNMSNPIYTTSSVDLTDDPSLRVSLLQPNTNERNVTNERKCVRKVCFSNELGVAFVDHELTPGDIHNIWYSSEEKIKMEQSALNDARAILDKLDMVPVTAISKNDVFECIGVEALLLQGSAKNKRDQMRAHVSSIIREQTRHQKRKSRKDMSEHLSRLSQKSSKWSQDRAHNLAVSYWKMLPH